MDIIQYCVCYIYPTYKFNSQLPENLFKDVYSDKIYLYKQNSNIDRKFITAFDLSEVAGSHIKYCRIK